MSVVERVPRLAYTIVEVAECLGISRAKAYSLIAAGELPSVTLGRSRRVRHEALVGYLDRLEVEQCSGDAS